MKISKIMGLGLASAMVHGAALFSLDQYINLEQGQIQVRHAKFAADPKGELDIEFVDTPSQAPPKTSPQKTKRISDKDSMNQDQSRNLAATPNIAPVTKVESMSNQLEKIKNENAQAPAPEVKPSETAEKALVAPKDEQKTETADEFMQQIVQDSVPQKASKPQEEIKGISSPDKITTQQMSRASSPGAALFGTTSFEATGSGMGVYMKQLKEKIWSSWFPYLAFRYPVDFKGADAIISFTLNTDGDIKMIRVVDDGGDATFASYCMQAVLKASGFGPVPKEILALTGKDDFELKFGFHYR